MGVRDTRESVVIIVQSSIRLIVKRSSRKTLAMRILDSQTVEIRAPLTVTQAQIDSFISQHQAWLSRHLAQAAQRSAQAAQQPPITPEEVRALGQKALTVIPERVSHFARLLGVSYGRITIRNQVSKWGSCSAQGNLNFNCLLMLCPGEVLDYVVVHELCHRKEMNHSPRFWAEVERVIPDYQRHRDWLKTQGNQLIERMNQGKQL